MKNFKLNIYSKQHKPPTTAQFCTAFQAHYTPRLGPLMFQKNENCSFICKIYHEGVFTNFFSKKFSHPAEKNPRGTAPKIVVFDDFRDNFWYSKRERESQSLSCNFEGNWCFQNWYVFFWLALPVGTSIRWPFSRTTPVS